MPRTLAPYESIASLRARYYDALPGKESLVKTITTAEVSEHVYNSNAIENSTLSLEETEKILLAIDLERFVSLREIHEARNLARVAEYSEEKACERAIESELICLLHTMLLANINESIAGRVRTASEWVRIGSYIAPDPKDVPTLLARLFTTYARDASSHVIARIAYFHLEFEHIHPFCDGNGRIGRVLNNHLLMREGYVPLNIAFADRARYYDAFREYDKKKSTRIMEEIVGRALAESYHKRLAYMEGREVVTLTEYAKVHKTSPTNLLNKAHRQTIEAFRERGVWKIRRDF